MDPHDGGKTEACKTCASILWVKTAIKLMHKAGAIFPCKLFELVMQELIQFTKKRCEKKNTARTSTLFMNGVAFVGFAENR
jgi:hypothetical protein